MVDLQKGERLVWLSDIDVLHQLHRYPFTQADEH